LTPPERSALVTLAIGSDFQDVARLTENSFRSYASRYDLDLIVITEPPPGIHPVWGKFACFDLLDTYERLIFADADVLIATEAPNLLAMVPPGEVGAYVVSEDTDYHDGAVGRIQEVLDDLGWKRDYFNCGVLVLSRNHKDLFDHTDPDFDLWKNEPEATYREQTYINYKVQQKGIPVFDIGYRFNHTLASANSYERFGSFLIHCKGHRPGTKLDEVRRTRFVLDHPYLRRLLIRYPRLTRIFDRLPRMPTPDRVARRLRRLFG
jgi:lipopolysaccharide biosynthesis glycosyltransferase